MTRLYVFALVLNTASLFIQVFFTVMYSDLETDFINPIDLCNRLNPYMVPTAVVNYILTAVFLFTGNWLSVIFMLPVILWDANKMYKNNHILDATEIFRTLNRHKNESFAKLGYHLVMFFYFLYRMIMALIDSE
ncbi:hypothetical protein CANCADRAFT_329 [Tortispora caseinolytica NRRL Y-17796]|uniref:Cornichon n=1 Tax=Tortispora caseinolytica NRRL Y-17796 TaxID=767744 RepID=A0A1E4TJ27_9ASCO|nr:hypothetical protein CANCADRAFT_329 [Tortispora caseinolytica NRRL Y-17796]